MDKSTSLRKLQTPHWHVRIKERLIMKAYNQATLGKLKQKPDNVCNESLMHHLHNYTIYP